MNYWGFSRTSGQIPSATTEKFTWFRSIFVKFSIEVGRRFFCRNYPHSDYRKFFYRGDQLSLVSETSSSELMDFISVISFKCWGPQGSVFQSTQFLLRIDYLRSTAFSTIIRLQMNPYSTVLFLVTFFAASTLTVIYIMCSWTPLHGANASKTLFISVFSKHASFLPNLPFDST